MIQKLLSTLSLIYVKSIIEQLMLEKDALLTVVLQVHNLQRKKLPVLKFIKSQEPLQPNLESKLEKELKKILMLLLLMILCLLCNALEKLQIDIFTRNVSFNS